MGHTARGYEPHIYAMHMAMNLREELREAAMPKPAEDIDRREMTELMNWYRDNFGGDALRALFVPGGDWRETVRAIRKIKSSIPIPERSELTNEKPATVSGG